MLFEELGKLKRSSIMTSITLIALGIIMVICPKEYTDTLVSFLGIVMLIGATYMALNFISSRKTLMNYVLLTGAIIMGLVGASVLIFSQSIVRLIGFVFGVLLIVSGLIDVFNAFTYARRSQRKGWWILLLLSALLILFGLIVLVNPWWNDAQSLFQVIGGILLFTSIVSLVRLVFVWPIRSV